MRLSFTVCFCRARSPPIEFRVDPPATPCSPPRKWQSTLSSRDLVLRHGLGCSSRSFSGFATVCFIAHRSVSSCSGLFHEFFWLVGDPLHRNSEPERAATTSQRLASLWRRRALWPTCNKGHRATVFLAALASRRAGRLRVARPRAVLKGAASRPP